MIGKIKYKRVLLKLSGEILLGNKSYGIDEKIITMLNESKSGKDLDAGKFLQRKHKTY